MKSVFILMRPLQWVKNLFVFAPLFFNGTFTDVRLLLAAWVATLSYCMAASAIYCFNDIYDCASDRQHPVKKLRPVASGQVSTGKAYSLAVLLAVIAFLLLFHFEKETRITLSIYLGAYLMLNVAYCIHLKRKTLIDVFVIAIGFVLRVLCGGAATGIWVSHWLVLMTFLLALFLALAKRRDDVVIYEGTGMCMRKNIERYNLDFMNQSITIVASVNIICYILYSVSPEVTERIGSDYLYMTSVFVLLAVLRYMQLTLVDVRSGSPTHVLLHDRFIQGCIIGWVALFVLIIYI